jgi:DNA-binding HxlR family transcriptional regulator
VRSYGQYCPIARALDLVGDRWTLLIVRELMMRGSCRYTDLANGLPGIATNMLSGRLRDMEIAGIVERVEAPPPVATTLFALTERGRSLDQVLFSLGAWGAELMTPPTPDDAFRIEWLSFFVRAFLVDREPDRPTQQITIDTGGITVHLRVGSGQVALEDGPAERADARLAGEPRVILGVLSGQMAIEDATSLGLELGGDASAVRRVVSSTIPAKNTDLARHGS